MATKKPIRLSAHAMQQLGYRGATEEQVIDTIRSETWEPAEHGRFGCRKDFVFNSEWIGNIIAQNRFAPFLLMNMMK